MKYVSLLIMRPNRPYTMPSRILQYLRASVRRVQVDGDHLDADVPGGQRLEVGAMTPRVRPHQLLLRERHQLVHLLRGGLDQRHQARLRHASNLLVQRRPEQKISCGISYLIYFGGIALLENLCVVSFVFIKVISLHANHAKSTPYHFNTTKYWVLLQCELVLKHMCEHQ